MLNRSRPLARPRLLKACRAPTSPIESKPLKLPAAIKPLPQALVPTLLNSLRGLESKPSNDTVSDAIREQWRFAGDLVTALGNAGAPAIPDLSRALDDHDEAVRRGAVDALIVIARVSPEALPVLVGALGNTHDDVPRRIEETIESNGNQALTVKIVPLLAPQPRRSESEGSRRERSNSVHYSCGERTRLLQFLHR